MVSAYEEWADARVANGEDPTDRPAFLAHLERLSIIPNCEKWGYPAAAPPPPTVLTLDFEGWRGGEKIQVGPLLAKWAAAYSLPMRALCALIHAESGFYTDAERWCRRTPQARAALAARDAGDPNWRSALQATIDGCYADGERYDISFGFCQFIYTTAAGEGVGDGYASIDNLLSVREQLFDPETGIRLAAKHYGERCYWPAVQMGYAGGEAILQGLYKYNSGSFQAAGSRYFIDYDANVTSYKTALYVLTRILDEKGWAGP